VILGQRNSRFKDFYDIYAMTGAFHFDRTTPCAGREGNIRSSANARASGAP
jgi:hypothetical protein